MHRRLVRFYCIVILAATFSVSAWELDTDLASPGGVIILFSETEEGLTTAEFYTDGRRISRGESFSTGGTQRALLLPVPCDTDEPFGSVRLQFSGGSVESAQVTIIPRTFIHEEIPLDGAMSDLRRNDDPRKAEESRLLWQLLNSFNPEARLGTNFILPLGEARESSHYGDRRIFLYSGGESSRSLHYGIDYAVPTGTPVKAPAGGRVVLATERMLTGFSMVIEHGPGIYSLYYHLNKLDAEEGERVEQGQIIAESGVSGLATGPHLHWELRINSVPIDPLLFLDRAVVEAVQP